MLKLLCCAAALLFAACNSSGNDEDDKFRQIDFNATYALLPAKQFSFTSPAVTASGEDCLAVTWEGELERDEYYYGFALGTPDNSFNLIVSFPKSNELKLYGSQTLAGQYTAVMRYNNEVYKDPITPLTINIYREWSTDTIITMNSITFTYPSTVILTPDSVSPNDYIRLSSY
jgi:hypothetical protein